MRDLILEANKVSIEDYQNFISDKEHLKLMVFLRNIILNWAELLDDKKILCLLKGVGLLTYEAFERMDCTEGIKTDA
jgi:hypothetical protein